MTVVVWDGKTLAADRRAVHAGLARTTTKIWRVRDMLVGGAGDSDLVRARLHWATQGFDAEKFPMCDDPDAFASLVVIMPDRTIWMYERLPHPTQFHDETFAIGSGRDFALAAMHLGCDAKRAVEVASHFDVGCGNGVDTLTL